MSTFQRLLYYERETPYKRKVLKGLDQRIQYGEVKDTY